MIKKIILIVLCLTVNNISFADKFKKEIDSNTQNLKAIQKTIKEKRLEKEKCLLEEKCIRRELGRIDRELATIEKNGAILRKKIKEAKLKLSRAEKELKAAGWEKQQWSGVIGKEAAMWFRNSMALASFSFDVVSDKIRSKALIQKKGFYLEARQKENRSKLAMQKWQAAQKNLNELKLQQEKMLEEQTKVKAQKQQFLSTTIGRRVVAEEDLKKLTESAKALQQLIIKLERDKKKSEDEALKKKKISLKKKNYSWPVEGQVVAKFGKTKHPELDTYVINNGIKIKAAQGAAIKSVESGEVIFSGDFRSYGLMVIVDHGGGVYSIYGQLGDSLVEEEQKVNEQEVIGHLSKSSQTLYFEIRCDGQAEDPFLWLK